MRIIVGRTPLDFEAFISMERLAFRATCWLMLAIFGGTSAVGPFWHRHHDHAAGHESVSCSHCVVVDSQLACELEDEQTGSSCHDHDHASHDSSTADAPEAASFLIATSTDDDCAVCRFYASAVSATVAVAPVLDRPAAAIAAPIDRSVARSFELTVAVRGPPLA